MPKEPVNSWEHIKDFKERIEALEAKPNADEQLAALGTRLDEISKDIAALKKANSKADKPAPKAIDDNPVQAALGDKAE